MKSISTALALGALATAGVLGTGIAGAEPDPAPTPATHPIGTQATVPEGPGVSGWTISDLRPSSDSIPYQPRGTLWEATATDEAVAGTVFPIIANLSARSASGQNYQALFTVPTAQGIMPTGLTQGQKTSGKVYFDVTGDAPNSLVYQAGGADLIRWVTPAPAPQAAPRQQAPRQQPQQQAPTSGGGSSHRAPAQQAPAQRPSRPVPATPPPSGSAGTPITEGSAGTPMP
ncbi:MPT63 family protein [Mycolicibacter sp. MYC123]|uniref:MPT63 family protein n=2 Tax=Mycolicibacter TaxID=1073531 RepID=A0ABU5YR44_9MYCO|nr:MULTISPECIES: MPT63 family protein [unclassified Mycolicibacter]MEB3051203.1 MPT63 family protein [Mycolicibacter sp. MYC123]MEB3061488.1 MPT63 family protein [Mycolicibacter sp. MYC101]MEB3067833.1 MPT63 family protein [Mycolicibacter sp. MYC017]